MENKSITEKESIAIITEMIAHAKQNVGIGEASFHSLLWGWSVALANLSHYLLEAVFQLYHAPSVWLIMIPTAIVSFLYGYMTKRGAVVQTHLEKLLSVIWISIAVIIFILLIFMFKINYQHNPIILLFSGLGTFSTGIIFKFKPLIAGGVIIWVGAIIAFLSPLIYHQLIAGIVIILGYLVPGYLLRKLARKGV